MKLPSDTMVVADAEQLKRVINNIIGNAIKYIDKTNGRISIHLKDIGAFIQVKSKITESGLLRLIYLIFLIAFIGQMHHVIQGRAAAVWALPYLKRLLRIMAGIYGLRVKSVSERQYFLH